MGEYRCEVVRVQLLGAPPSGIVGIFQQCSFEYAEDAVGADQVVLTGQEGPRVLLSVGADATIPVGSLARREAEDFRVLNGVGRHFLCVVGGMW